MMQLSVFKISLTGIIVAMIFILAGLAGKHYLLNKPVAKQMIWMNVEPDCQLRSRSCLARVKQHNVTLELVGTVHYLKPFQIKVSPQGFDELVIQRVVATFSMVGMEMGINRYILSKNSKGEWLGAVILPVCSSGRTDWHVELRLETNEMIYLSKYALKVG